MWNAPKFVASEGPPVSLVEFSPKATSQNILLRGLSEEDYASVSRHLETVKLGFRQVIWEPGQIADYAYFPDDSVISLVRVLDDGSMIEVGIVGYEGMAGIDMILGGNVQLYRAISQGGGGAMRIHRSQLIEEFRRGGPLQTMLLRFTHAFMLQVAQTAACNRLHPLSNRLARWLLFMHDRVTGDVMQITQEFLSYMLGSRRAGINEAMQQFKQSHLIRHSRNRITVVDRKGLEGASCECYESVRREFERTLGAKIGKS